MARVSKLLDEELYANAAVSDEEVANAGQLPYKSFVRGVTVDFSPKNIRRVIRFKAEILGAETNYRTRQATDQRLDEVLADLCIPGATWRLSSSQPAVPIQLRRTKLLPLARDDIIADNMAVITQGLQGKENLSFPASIN
ncbi:hypothetical protein PIB30_104964 [Stylosanthes scabra]|uniref:Uncharacterized protein n=1 Tax=Stylosanthes scabra TaxID=79078 RepID=A0ABU6WZ35_9FABA|nr:hypothetical protein [Stylosanthes scabra]